MAIFPIDFIWEFSFVFENSRKKLMGILLTFDVINE